MNKEVWKDIKGFEGMYQVSNHGRIKSLDRYVRVGGGGTRLVKGGIRKPIKCRNGYYEVQIQVKRNRTIKMLHRVVAEAFIDNPNDYPKVNHKDEDISNNCADNLEWCTAKYNANYGTRNIRCKESKKKYEKPVNQYTKDGEFIRHWDCIMDAERGTGADVSAIIRVCKGKQNTSMGYKWQYA